MARKLKKRKGEERKQRNWVHPSDTIVVNCRPQRRQRRRQLCLLACRRQYRKWNQFHCPLLNTTERTYNEHAHTKRGQLISSCFCTVMVRPMDDNECDKHTHTHTHIRKQTLSRRRRRNSTVVGRGQSQLNLNLWTSLCTHFNLTKWPPVWMCLVEAVNNSSNIPNTRWPTTTKLKRERKNKARQRIVDGRLLIIANRQQFRMLTVQWDAIVCRLKWVIIRRLLPAWAQWEWTVVGSELCVCVLYK